MKLPVAIEEAERETDDFVLDRAGAPLPAALVRQIERKRRGRPPLELAGTHQGPWFIERRVGTETGSKARWLLRCPVGHERVVKQSYVQAIAPRCWVCEPPTPQRKQTWHPPLVLSRDSERSRRKHDVRATTVSMKRLTKTELQIGAAMYPDEGERELRPVVRGECEGGVRPCPFVSCRFNLYIDVAPRTGAIKLNFPDLEVEQMGDSCALDVADRGGATLEQTAAVMNVTRERIRQLETTALARFERIAGRTDLRDYLVAGPDGKRRLPLLEVVQ